MELIYQAIAFGIISLIIGLILYNIFVSTNDKFFIINKSNTKYEMEASFFFTGIILRYLLEVPIIKKYIDID